MEIPANEWLTLTEMGIDDPITIRLDDFIPGQLAASFEDDLKHCYPSTMICHSSFDKTTSRTCDERSTKQLKLATNWESPTKTQNNSKPEATVSPSIISFGDSNLQQYHGSSVGFIEPENQEYRSLGFEVRNSQGSHAMKGFIPKTHRENKRTGPLSSPPCPQDHVIAERKRRERLNERFIALSAVIPGLTKMDKASVLGDSIKYMKQLQDRVRTLEKQTSNETMESTIFLKKFQIVSDGDLSSTDENCTPCSNDPLPEIQARVSNKNILIRIHCEKRKGVLVKALIEIEKLNLSIVSSSIIPFGTSTMDITIMTQMNEEFNMTTKVLVKILHSAFVKFMRKM